MSDLIEREPMPTDEIEMGAEERSLQHLAGQIAGLDQKAVLMNTGSLFLSETFRGDTNAAYLLSNIRNQFPGVRLRIVPSAVIQQYQRQKANKTGAGINVEDDKEVLREIGELCRTAGSRGASDIHMFPEDGRQQVLIKVDGVLKELESYDLSYANQMMQAVHVACEKSSRETSYLVHKYQQGRLMPDAIGGIDGYEAIRCQWNPETDGRDLFMRLQKPIKSYGSFKGLHYRLRHIRDLERALKLGKGGVVLAAPTNSGKTTTMAMMCTTKLSKRRMNGISIEDPPEFKLPMRQFSINVGDDEEEIRRATNKAFKAINRSDPDAVMVGEMRGGEFGDVVVKIAASHFLIGSFHADNSMEAFPQLARLGIDPADVFNPKVFRYLIAQRLLQRLCDCAEPIGIRAVDNDIHLARMAELGLDLTKARKRGSGCAKCNGTGVSGLFPVVEIIKTSQYYMDAVRARDVKAANSFLIENHVPSMADEAMTAISQGQADPENVMDALSEFEDTDIRFGVLDE